MSKPVPIIKIEKGIPVPPFKHAKWPFRDMKVGDSFLVSADNIRVRQAASYWGTRHGTKFAVRQVKDGYRCWRVK